ncbi:hypothetical protein CLOP_g25607 [Closterium sp. NIES-67]|nr:hypothetical protein CLOP_g25607 [Closterium sp. NIES-67]
MPCHLSPRWPLPPRHLLQPLLVARAVLGASRGIAHVAPDSDRASCCPSGPSAADGEGRGEGGEGGERTGERAEGVRGRGEQGRGSMEQGRDEDASGGGTAAAGGSGEGHYGGRRSEGHLEEHFPHSFAANGAEPSEAHPPRYTPAGLPHVVQEGGLQQLLQRVGLWPAAMAPQHRLPPGFPPPLQSARLGDTRTHPGVGVGVAVSGGVDSMALALTAAHMLHTGRHGRQQQQQQQVDEEEECGDEEGGGGVRVVAMVVDHALRAGSAHDAKRAVDLLSQLGLHAVLLTCRWPHGPPPVSRMQQEARAQRYALLQWECVQRGLAVLMTAHHADDQAELLLLRLSRCSGLDGLACMPLLSSLPPSPPPLPPCLAHLHARSATGSITGSSGRSSSACLESPVGDIGDGRSNEGIVVVRPFLGVRKQQLVQLCRAHGQAWIEDPSNASSLFLRNRIRHALTALPHHDASALLAAAHSTISLAATLRSHRLAAAHRLLAAALLPASVSASLPAPSTHSLPVLLARCCCVVHHLFFPLPHASMPATPCLPLAVPQAVTML